MDNLANEFGCMVFNNAVMQARLPKETYKVLRQAAGEGRSLNRGVADVVANTVKGFFWKATVRH